MFSHRRQEIWDELYKRYCEGHTEEVWPIEFRLLYLTIYQWWFPEKKSY